MRHTAMVAACALLVFGSADETAEEGEGHRCEMYKLAGAVALTPVAVEHIPSVVRGPKVPVPASLARLSAAGSAIIALATAACMLEQALED